MIPQQKYEMGYLMASLMLHVYFEQMIVSSPVAMILHQKYEMGYLMSSLILHVYFEQMIVSSPHGNDSATKIRNGISHVIPNTPCLFRTNDCFVSPW